MIVNGFVARFQAMDILKMKGGIVCKIEFQNLPCV